MFSPPFPGSKRSYRASEDSNATTRDAPARGFDTAPRRGTFLRKLLFARRLMSIEPRLARQSGRIQSPAEFYWRLVVCNDFEFRVPLAPPVLFRMPIRESLF